jgi:hypothetical protein
MSKQSEQKKIEDNIKQTDGAIKRLNILVDRYMESDNDHFSKVIKFYSEIILKLGVNYFLCFVFARFRTKQKDVTNINSKFLIKKNIEFD